MLSSFIIVILLLFIYYCYWPNASFIIVILLLFIIVIGQMQVKCIYHCRRHIFPATEQQALFSQWHILLISNGYSG